MTRTELIAGIAYRVGLLALAYDLSWTVSAHLGLSLHQKYELMIVLICIVWPTPEGEKK